MLVLGVVVGVVLSVVTTEYVVPALAGDEDMEPGDLVILSGRDQSEDDQRQALIDQWNSIFPQHRASIRELPSSADQQHSQMVAQAQSDEEQVDVFNLDVTWTPEFADAGYIRPLESADTSGFLDKPLRTCLYEGKLWALPFNTDAGLLFYQSELVKVLPETWEGVTEEIKRVRAQPGAAKIRAGLTTQLDDYEGLTVTVTEAVLAAGGEVVDDSGNVALGSDEAQEGLRGLVDGVQDPAVNLRASLDYDEIDSLHAFRDGRALFMRNWPVAYRNLTKSAEPGAERPEMSVTELPGPSVLGGQNLAVAAKSGKPRAARKLIEFLTSPRSQQILFERGGLAATRHVVYLDPVVTGKYPYARQLLAAVENARLRPVTPHYSAFSAKLRELVRPMLLGGALPPDYEEQLQRALDGR